MVDVFEEVEEQIRSDRYRALGLRLLPWLIGVVVLSLAGVGVWQGYRAWSSSQSAKASEAYAKGLEAQQSGRTEEAKAAWETVAAAFSPAYKSLALQHLGALRLAERDVKGAVEFFDKAAKAAPDPLIGDAARLKAVYALLDTAKRAEIETRLEPLLKPGRPYRLQAREAAAFTKLLAGDTAGARADFVVVSLSPDAPEGARNRATAAMALIDSGSAARTRELVSAAVALPPRRPPPPGVTSPLQGPAQ
ncbi:MAG: tetratricopeptide repeat protein [Phenylobacterium sp.]